MVANSKASVNVNCWVCDHFQRYERGDEPASCMGDCRFNLPSGNIFSGQLDDKDITAAIPWTLIQESPFLWCGKFQRSKEKNLPPAPPSQDNACLTTDALPFDWELFNSNPWNKKIGPGYVDAPQKGVACWNCDNWQALTPHRNTLGLCRAKPPRPFIFGAALDKVFWVESNFARFNRGACEWCAQWQRALHDVPDPLPNWDCPAAEQIILENPPIEDGAIEAVSPGIITSRRVAKEAAAKKTGAGKSAAKKAAAGKAAVKKGKSKKTTKAIPTTK